MTAQIKRSIAYIADTTFIFASQALLNTVGTRYAVDEPLTENAVVPLLHAEAMSFVYQLQIHGRVRYPIIFKYVAQRIPRLVKLTLHVSCGDPEFVKNCEGFQHLQELCLYDVADETFQCLCNCKFAGSIRRLSLLDSGALTAEGLFPHIFKLKSVAFLELGAYRLTAGEVAKLPQSIQKVRLHSFRVNDRGPSLDTAPMKELASLTEIGNGFSAGVMRRSEVDLSGLAHVVQIGDDFCPHNHDLLEIDLAPLSKVTNIGGWFLQGSERVAKLDLSKFDRLTSVGDKFCQQMSRLAQVNCHNLASLRVIGSDFFGLAHALHELDLSHLVSVVSIGPNFLSRSGGLMKLDLSGFVSLTRISSGFCSGLDSLTQVNLSGLTQVQEIDDFFFAYCDNLVELDASFLGASLRKVGRGCFLSSHSPRTTAPGKKIDLSSWTRVVEVGKKFASGSPLTEQELGGFELCPSFKRLIAVRG